MPGKKERLSVVVVRRHSVIIRKDELVDKAIMSTATPSRHTVLSREMAQGKGTVQSIMASAPQLDPANCFRSQREMLTFCQLILTIGKT